MSIRKSCNAAQAAILGSKSQAVIYIMTSLPPHVLKSVTPRHLLLPRLWPF